MPLTIVTPLNESFAECHPPWKVSFQLSPPQKGLLEMPPPPTPLLLYFKTPQLTTRTPTTNNKEVVYEKGNQ